MANIFKSKFTGEQIDEILQKAQDTETPIEVQANPQGEPTAELDKLKVGDIIYGTPRPIDVVANPTSVGEADLTKLRVGSTVYNIPQPQAPTTVVANPQGAPTRALEKLQVGSDIYEIPIEANPDEPAIGNLDKLRVGQGVYSIPTSTTVVANPVGGGNTDLHSIQVGDVKYNIVEPETVAANPLQEATSVLSKLQVGSTVYSIPNEGGNGSGGTQLYKHSFYFEFYGLENAGQIVIISTSATPFNILDGNSYPFYISSVLGITNGVDYFYQPCEVMLFDRSDGTYLFVEINSARFDGSTYTFEREKYEVKNVQNDVVTPL